MAVVGKKLVLLGGGGHCKSVLDAVLRVGEYDDIVIVDPDLQVGTDIYGCQVVGDDSILPHLKQQGYECAFIAIGSISDTSLRRKLAARIKSLGFEIPVISDPSAVISRYAEIGPGTFVGKNAIINADAVIGKHCIINTGSIVEHECRIDDFTHVSVGSILCGNSHIGSSCLIGAGAVVIQGLTIGNNTIVGANSTVLTNLEDNVRVYRFVTGGYSLAVIYLLLSRSIFREVA